MSPVFEMNKLRYFSWIMLVAALLPCGCDEPSNAEPAADRTSKAPAVAQPAIEIESVVPLTPDRPTHLAINSTGALLWVQETADGQDVTFVMGGQGVPLATPLTSRNILKGLGASKARGNIQSLAGARDDLVFVYFSGRVDDRAVCCIGQYSLTASRFFVLAETEALLQLTGLGASLEKSQGRIVAGRMELWLWLTNDESTVGIRISAERGSAGSKLKFEKAFATIVAKEGSIPLTGGIEVWGGPEDSLYLTDQQNQILRHVLSDGTQAASYALDYAAISQPVVDPRLGTIVFGQNPAATTQPASSQVRLTALREGKVETLSFDQAQNLLGAEPGVMRIGEFLLERPGSYIGYDSTSGHILRLKMMD